MAESFPVPIGRMTESLLGVKMGEPARAPRARHSVVQKRVESDDEEEQEEKKGGFPWFLVISIVVLAVVVGIAGFMAYKYWKRRQEEMQQVQGGQEGEVHVLAPAITGEQQA